ncbi:MAG: hypothetical protein QM805_11735 [Pseudomonas sp.]
MKKSCNINSRRPSRERSAMPAPSAISAGGVSPMGEPLAMLAADRAHVAHLFAANTRQELAERGKGFREHGQCLAVCNAGTDGDRIVALAHALQIAQPADEDDRIDRPHLLGHPEPDIG